ncbi:MAG TPA: PDZ domain-containing protein [Candidatus Aphodocola excrementigallinarum]|uniref:PDZ domain-containing protein n=1 Tax=Candidatus Aphodocola excrementigallinarum TaxID=2840670 RepID=A0A9D1IMP7_9FIRM|nr:PDZ domain-containing protein [Candidatus Aphodocola excrementigallinarum]
MFFKKFKSFIAIILVATFIMPNYVLAYSKYIVAGGENIGLQINNDGIIIAGFYKVNDSYPGYDANLNKGDTIIKVDGKDVKSIDDFISSIENGNKTNLKLTYKRNNKEMDTTLNLINENGIIKTGLYVKDMVSGIGTLTFIDPNTKLYGALGHEVLESQSGTMIDVKDGKIYNSTVTGIEKSERGEPGSKNADVNSNTVYGDIKENTISGIFGNYTREINKDNLYKVAEYEDIKLGSAKIITVLEGNLKSEYDINILKVNNDKNSNKNILFEITDDNLLEKAGGVVQGMSGSPIIQGDNIIGAVTNVVVNSPEKGYGILITSMLEEAEN